MSAKPEHQIRRAGPEDAAAAAQLLHDFNEEFEDVTPGPEVLAARVRELLAGGETVVLLGGTGPDGVALLRFRSGLWSESPECYLAELYVRPERRGRGLGRRLMEAVLDAARERGADHIDLGTGEADIAARNLYESLGFTNREGVPDGPVMYFYEREL